MTTTRTTHPTTDSVQPWGSVGEFFGRLAFVRIWSAVLVHTNGWHRLFQPLMNRRILAVRSRTDAKVPRWMACFSMIPNQTSTRFSQDPEVGVKCTWIRGLAASHWRTSTRLWVA